MSALIRRDDAGETLLLPSPALRTCAAGTLRWTPLVIDGWSDLFEASPRLSPSAVLLVDCSERPEDAALSENLEELSRQHPSIAVVAALDLGQTPAATLRRLQEHGVADFLDLDLENTPELAAARVADARGRPFRREVEGALSSYVSADARQLLRGAVDVALRGGGAAELAALYGVSTVTLSKWCATAGLPFPRTLQLWMRLLLAAFLLGEPRRTALSVATLCGYGSDRSLRRALGRMTGGSPRTFRRADAFPTVARAFDAALFAVREEQRSKRRA
jgi:AraC-like DNA-binding protein